MPLVLSFLTFGLIGILTHEMWQDELQAWMIARDSSSIFNLLFQNLRYEGHPGLWYLGLYLITRVTHNPFFMQLYHLFIATISVYILAKFSPFTNLQKWLLSFGYFSLFEYCIISRSYVLGILLLYIFCALFPYRQKGYLLLSLVLLLLANTHVYGLIMAIALGLTLVCDYLLIQPKKPLRKWDVIISILIFITGIIISVVQMIPPADSGFALGWHRQFDLLQLSDTLNTITRSYIPIPQVWNYNFWGTSLTDRLTGPEVFKLLTYIPNTRLSDWIAGVEVCRIVVSVLIMSLAVSLFWRKPVVLFMYTCGTLGILTFTYVKYLGYIRHHGNLSIFFIACVWISHYYQESNFAVLKIPRFSLKFRNKCNKVFFLFILYASMIGGVFAFSSDVVHPFSQGKAVADFIRQQNLYNMPMIGSIDYAASTQAGYLDRKIYYPESNSFGTFIIWNNQRKLLSNRKLIKKIKKFVYTNNQDTLLILNHEPKNTKDKDFISLIPQYFDSNYIVSSLKHFDKSIWHEDNYTLYMIKHK